ncbi:MAG TPA: hypothetical protein VIV60_07205 [Polyangiaceae bacterium]
MATLRISSAVLTSLCVSMACESSSTSGSNAIAFVDLPAKYADAACTAWQACYGPMFGLFMNGMDCATLTVNRFENGTFSLIERRIQQGSVKYDENQAPACLDALKKLSCTQLLERDQPECVRALDGTVALGAPCDLNEECQGSAICQAPDGTCPGKCVPLRAAGQACAADGDCDDGLQCSKATNSCVKPAALGEACENGAPPCGPGLLCLGKDDTAGTSGTCRSAIETLTAAEGAACDPVAGILCQPGTACIGDHFDVAAAKVAWLCAKMGSFAGGEACKPGFPDACASGHYCKTGTGLLALQGTCTPIPDAKEPCGTGIGAQCKAGAVCVAGTCETYAANGVDCTADGACFSEYCGQSGGCEPRLPCH